MTLFSEKRPLPKCSAYPSNYNCRKVSVIRRFPYLGDHAPRDDAESTGNSKVGEEGNILPVKDSEPNDMECETSIPMMLSKANVEEALGQWVTVDNDVQVLVKTPYQPKPVDVPESITTEVEPITGLDNHASRVDAGSTENSEVGEEGNTVAVRKSEGSERNYMECETTETMLSNVNVEEEAHWQWVRVDDDMEVLVKPPDQPKPSNLLENITEAQPITTLDISTFLSHTLARVSKYPSTKIPKGVDFPLRFGRRNDTSDSNLVLGNKCSVSVDQMQVADPKRSDGKQIEVQIQDGNCFKKQLEDNALEELDMVDDKICSSSVQLIHCETDTKSIDDISQGKEEKPVGVINVVDDEKLPPFRYITNVIYPEWYESNHSVPRGCGCINGCVDFEICSCTVRYGGDIPYTLEGAIVRKKHRVYECGPSCKCPPSCQNRVSQNGIRYRLEIFKTEKMGWGVRSRDFIQSGGFVCEYTGELLQEQEAEERVGDDEYLFDIGGRNGSGFTIDAAKFGNVGRFINHSCSPNLYAQNVLYDHDDKRMPHIMFFATKNIPPLRELTYDYNYKVGRVRDANGNIKRKDCYCGSRMCSGRLY